MATQLTAEDARLSLNNHVADKGAEVFAKYGPTIGLTELRAILEDRACVRYPCELVFDGSRLNPGEFAFPEPKGESPEDGFTLLVHPIYMMQAAMVPYLAFYHLVVVNYGVFASPDDAETYAAAALGIPRDLYYDTLCHLADELGGSPDEGAGLGVGLPVAVGCGGGCSCGGD